MTDDITKVPISKVLWERAHVAYIIRESKSVSKQEAVRAILQQYVDQFDEAQARERLMEEM